jgi:hypothetical protein
MDPIYSSTHVLQGQLTKGFIDSLKDYGVNNQIILGLITIIMLSSSQILLEQLRNIPNLLKFSINLFKTIIMLPYIIYLRLTSIDKYKVESVVNKITKSRKTNPLFTVINWYIDSQITKNSTKDRYEFYVDDQIVTNCDPPQIHKRVNDDICDNFTWIEKDEKHIIYYSYSENSIKVDGEEKEKNIRNDTVTMWTYHCDDKFILDRFLIYCQEKYIEFIKDKNKKPQVYHNVANIWIKVGNLIERNLDSIILKNNQNEKIMSMLNHFINQRDWYTVRGIVHSLGILLHGKPGCGKTSIIRAIASYTKRSVFHLRLSEIKTHEAWNELFKDLQMENSILVIEEFDTTDAALTRDVRMEKKKLEDEFKKIKNMEMNVNKIEKIVKMENSNNNASTLSSDDVKSLLLNLMDGYLTRPGQIIILTTNHLEYIDPALIRSGRIDLKLELQYCDRDMIRRMYKMFYKSHLIDGDDDFLFDNFDKIEYSAIDQIESNIISPAQVIEIFRTYPNDGLLALYEIKKII